MAGEDETIVITGTSGLLGGYLFTRWPGHGTVHGFDRNATDLTDTHVVDLTDPAVVARTVAEIAPTVIINCAAMTNVDACEENEETALAVNATAVRTLADAADRVGARLVHISTDAVFGDYGSRPYTETDEPRPINAYGRTKYAGERAALSAQSSLVLRTTIFGWNTVRKKGSFGEWIYRTVRDHQPATVFSDVRFAPIYIGRFAELLVTALDAGLSGVYHLAGGDVVTKEVFAREMARRMVRRDDNLASGTLADVPLKAPRAHNMALDSAAFARRCDVSLPNYAESIAAFLADAPGDASDNETTRR